MAGMSLVSFLYIFHYFLPFYVFSFILVKLFGCEMWQFYLTPLGVACSYFDCFYFPLSYKRFWQLIKMAIQLTKVTTQAREDNPYTFLFTLLSSIFWESFKLPSRWFFGSSLFVEVSLSSRCLPISTKSFFSLNLI